MAELICRTLRDGRAEGEQAPALILKDTISCPVGSFVFDYILSQLCSFILHRKSQENSGIVLVALSRSPVYYEEFLKRQGYDFAASSKWIRVLDCHSDPLGWKRKLVESGSIGNHTYGTSVSSNVCENVRDFDKLSSSIVELGKEMVGDGKGQFLVAIDLVSEMLRLTSLTSVAALLSNLRSHENISSLFWLLHSDLHETGTTAALEYISSIQASVEPMAQPVDKLRVNFGNSSWMEQNLRKGKFSARFKRRNGRVRMMVEELHIEKSGITFSPIFEDRVISQSIVPKVQFNLQLSEKERNDRAKVVLPFEHQGNGKDIQIYDGRKSDNEGKAEVQPNSVEKVQTVGASMGEIVYFRDSDDETPDSDEDPDDDLDI